jgi:hypothetical protein
MVSEPPRVHWRRVLRPQGLGVLLVCPIGEVGPGGMELGMQQARTSITVMELTPSTWSAVRGHRGALELLEGREVAGYSNST